MQRRSSPRLSEHERGNIMFRRRHKQKFSDQIRSAFFPRKGWKRVLSYLTHRLRRRPGEPHFIAMGVACGVGISFLPYLGIHLLSGYLLARLLKGDIFAMVVGTTIGNPWTFPFMFFAAYHLGNFIMGQAHLPPEGIPFEPVTFSFHTMMSDPMALLLPMTIGAVILGLLCAIFAYYLVYGMVHGYQSHRKKQLSDRRLALNRMLHELRRDEET